MFSERYLPFVLKLQHENWMYNNESKKNDCQQNRWSKLSKQSF